MLKIAEYIFIKPQIGKADLIFIFGTRHNGAAEKAYDLYKNKLASKILISGGMNRITKEKEAEKLSQKLVRLSVKETDIILENKSANTLENVLFSKKVIKEKIGFKDIKKIAVVAKNYHIRRAIMTLKKHFPKSIEYLPVPYGVYGWNKSNWFKNSRSKEKIIGEYKKIQKYLLKGDLEEI